jgi:nickel-type superoxide dismutase maturation protease
MSTERGRPRSLSASLARGLALGAGLAAAAAARRWLDVVEVRGTSMAPTLLPGEWLLVERRTFTRRSPRAGEIVLAPDPRDRTRELVKRVVAVDEAAGTLELGGDAPNASTDSRAFGAVPIADVRWRAVVRYWPSARAGRLTGRIGDSHEGVGTEARGD